MQVCGNTESVKLLNEWLCQWYERGFQPSKDFLSSDEEKSQDADYNCSESDSDSENIGAEDRLKNVLLIVGPPGVCDKTFCHQLFSFCFYTAILVSFMGFLCLCVCLCMCCRVGNLQLFMHALRSKDLKSWRYELVSALCI